MNPFLSQIVSQASNPDTFSETHVKHYGERVKNSFGGVVFGLILFVASFLVLWFNEGNNVRQIKKADYIARTAIPVAADSVDRANDGKLIAVSGPVTTDQTLTDGDLSVPNALVLRKDVRMYQWKEKKQSTEKKSVGGNVTETTTYSYHKVWSSALINSDSFRQPSHANPKSIPVPEAIVTAQRAALGAFMLTPVQTAEVGPALPVSDLPERDGYTISGGEYYSGDPQSPEIGDIRISYTFVPSGTFVSFIGRQRNDNTLTSMQTPVGSVFLQYDGSLSKEEILAEFEWTNMFMSYGFRLLGFFLMFIGMSLIVNPIITIASFIPALSGVASFFSGIVIFLLSLILTTLTVAVAWMAYRPLFAAGLFGAIFVLSVFIAKTVKARGTPQPFAAPQEPSSPSKAPAAYSSPIER